MEVHKRQKDRPDRHRVKRVRILHLGYFPKSHRNYMLYAIRTISVMTYGRNHSQYNVSANCFYNEKS